MQEQTTLIIRLKDFFNLKLRLFSIKQEIKDLKEVERSLTQELIFLEEEIKQEMKNLEAKA